MSRILHVSDTHFLRDPAARGGDGASGYDRMIAELGDVSAGLRACLARGLAGGADLVVLSGDLTDGGDAEDYRALRAIFDEELERAGRAEVPMLVTPGNHDHKEAMRAGWLGETDGGTEGAGETTASSFTSTHRSIPSDDPDADPESPLHAVEVVDGVAFVAFDSARFGRSDGFVDEGRAAWLARTLDGLGDMPVVLVTHHHLDPDQFATPAVSCPDAFWDTIASHDVRLILCGHTHHVARGQVRGIPYLTAQGLSFQGDNLPGGGGVRFTRAYGYGLYDLGEDGRVRHVETHVFEDGRQLGVVRFS